MVDLNSKFQTKYLTVIVWFLMCAVINVQKNSSYLCSNEPMIIYFTVMMNLVLSLILIVYGWCFMYIQPCFHYVHFLR